MKLIFGKAKITTRKRYIQFYQEKAINKPKVMVKPDYVKIKFKTTLNVK